MHFLPPKRQSTEGAFYSGGVIPALNTCIKTDSLMTNTSTFKGKEKIRVKKYSSLQQASLLQELTCHMGSHRHDIPAFTPAT